MIGHGGSAGRTGVGVRGNSGGNAQQSPGTIGVLGVSDPNSEQIAVPARVAGVYGLSSGQGSGVLGCYG